MKGPPHGFGQAAPSPYRRPRNIPRFPTAGGPSGLANGGLAQAERAFAALIAAAQKPEIRTGEITGWRLWRWRDNLLHSLTISSFVWEPHTMPPSRYGWYETPVIDDPPSSLNCYGYHAFAERDEAVRLAVALGRRSFDEPLLVLGSVAMWGETVECERGWRSQYAYPLSFDAVYPAMIASFSIDLLMKDPMAPVEETVVYRDQEITLNALRELYL